jgi:adenylate kinase family enzyme
MPIDRAGPRSHERGGEHTMKRVAVFGNAGAGKSTLARHLAKLTRLPLHVLDKIQFRDGGDAVPHEEYLRAHADLLRQDEWIVDGFGDLATAWERFDRADTLIHIDLPVTTHYWWITKRLIKGMFADPQGWPKDSPLWSSSLQSYKVVWRCHTGLTPRYRRLITDAAASKRVHHLRSAADIRTLLDTVAREVSPSSPGSRP